MFVFFVSCIALLLGYFFYGVFVETVFPDTNLKKTPALRYTDYVDYLPLSAKRCFLIQFLNIAGLGPVFGAILGAVYGPAAFLWIVLGSIFAGGVHDFLSGKISLHYKGQSLIGLLEKFFGKSFKSVFLIFITIFLLLVGSVFATSPAAMLAQLTNLPFLFWITLIFGYYFLATLLPIDKIIGRVYPIFALLLLLSTVLLIGILLFHGMPSLSLENISFANQHPNKDPIFPLMFITIACGALSGFHSTQSPMIAKCITKEKYARPVFYGAMITEGFIALIWATLGLVFYQGTNALSTSIASGGPGHVVAEISRNFLGTFGSTLTVLSIVILSITTGDTAFRSARLNLADCLHISQRNLAKRLILSIVVLGGGIFFAMISITKIWTYFGWTNQILASLTLWLCAMYLKRKKRFYWIALFPAFFITAVCTTYLFYSPLCFGMNIDTAQTLGLICTLSITLIFFLKGAQKKGKLNVLFAKLHAKASS